MAPGQHLSRSTNDLAGTVNGRRVGDADPDVPLIDLVEPTGDIAAGEPIVAESRIVDRIPSAVAERFSPTRITS